MSSLEHEVVKQAYLDLNKKILEIREKNYEFNMRNERWKEVQQGLPDLGKRIFELRGKHYEGCGFHYGLEKSIGYLLWKVNDFDKSLNPVDCVVLEVLYEELCEQVVKAELSLKGK